MRGAVAVLDKLGADFVAKRKVNKAEAYLGFQEGLMSNIGALAPLISPKDLMALSVDIEDYMKGITSASGSSPEKQMREFLTSTLEDELPKPPAGGRKRGRRRNSTLDDQPKPGEDEIVEAGEDQEEGSPYISNEPTPSAPVMLSRTPREQRTAKSD